MPDRPDQSSRQGRLNTLCWAAYLACSWTWCIGMFLPVLLVRDFGIWGFIVFAVPNVVGAAGMGWVLRSRATARRITREHSWAATAFTVVTVTFQIVFLVSVVCPSPAQLFARLPPWGMLVLVAALIGLALPRKGKYLGVLVWLASVGLLAGVAALGGMDCPIHAGTEPWASSGPAATDVVWLAPVCIFGFALCPYLDLTFCKARESMPRASARAAFTIGFGALFLVMIVATLGYAWMAIAAMMVGEPMGGLARTLLAFHIGLQIMFTVMVHLLEALKPQHERSMRRLFPLLVAMIIASAAALAFGFLEYHGLTIWEVMYRLFMAFYGLVFPAYVWLCMIPACGEVSTQRPDRAKLRVLALAVVLAAPCYWMGFIERQTWWLAPGLLIVLLARLLIRAAPSSAAEAARSPIAAPSIHP